MRSMTSELSVLVIIFNICASMCQSSGPAYTNEDSNGNSGDLPGGILHMKGPTNSNCHPLDPITPEEIRRTYGIIKAKNLDMYWVVIDTDIMEPPKSILFPLLMAENNGVNTPYNLPRKTMSILYEPSTAYIYEAVVNLNTKTVETFKKAARFIPLYQNRTFEEIIRNDNRVQKRIVKAGYTPDSVYIRFSTTYNRGMDEKYRGRHLIHYSFFGENFAGDNVRAHPLDFFVVCDFFTREIVSIEDTPAHDQFTVRNHNEDVTPAHRPANYDPKLPGFGPGKLRADVKPLKVTFPKGPSYTVDGNEVSWQKFKFRIRFTSKEGLVIHNVIYNDAGKVRPLFYRLSLSDLSVVYGDPRPPFHLKQSYDEGRFGMGRSANSLVDGQDCIGATTFFGGAVANADGTAQDLPNVICLSESDDGILWKHTDSNKKTNIARSRRLTVMLISTVGNYEYISNWHFYQDATISYEVQATGIVLGYLLAKGATPYGHGSIVFPQINAQYHQHIYSVRIDPMIDGQKNTVSMVDVVPVKDASGSPKNPYGNGFTTKQTVLRTAGQGRTNISPFTSRYWKISNDDHINQFTEEPVAYRLVTQNSPVLILRENSFVGDSMSHARHSILVTPYKEGQLYSPGNYMNGHGIAEYVEENKDLDIEDEDIVIYHNFIGAHVPVAEDFPVMSYGLSTGFTLKPSNFFHGNPAVDVP